MALPFLGLLTGLGSAVKAGFDTAKKNKAVKAAGAVMSAITSAPPPGVYNGGVLPGAAISAPRIYNVAPNPPGQNLSQYLPFLLLGIGAIVVTKIALD